ncbi:MAG: ribosomal protein S18-alanine N-acetyltransferase [Candidatus Dormibacteria bacterium]
MQVIPRLAVERMVPDDIATVQAIEREIFVSPWPKNAYASELAQNRQACYVVLRNDEGEIVGYGGLWKVNLEAHITTIGVRLRDQGRGFGRCLLIALIQRAYVMGARWITLEVRNSNRQAIGLYEGFGFKAIGRRRGYYTDNGEDAIIMWSDSIHAPAFKRRFTAMLRSLAIAGIGEEPPAEYPRS